MYLIQQYLAPFLMLAVSLSLHGQSEETVQLRFITFPTTVNPIEAELIVGKRETVKLNITSNAISEAISAPPLSEWIIGETIDTPEGNSSFKVYGRTPTTGSKNQIVLMLRKGPELSDGVKLILIDDAELNFGLGDILFINATKVRVGGIVGEDKFDIMPGAYQVVDPAPNDTGRYYHAKLFYQKEKSAVPFYSSNWPYTTKTRAMVFIYEDPETGKIMRHVARGII